MCKKWRNQLNDVIANLVQLLGLHAGGGPETRLPIGVA